MSVKIQFLNGGLANQTFQYIFARYYELSHPGQKMYLDDSYFANNTVHNGYELEKVFGLKPNMLSEVYQPDMWETILKSRREEGKSIAQFMADYGVPTAMIAETANHTEFNAFDGQIYPIPANGYYPEILDAELDGIIYYHGYWINPHWFYQFEQEFRKELSFPAITDEKNLKYLTQIKTQKSVSIHIRRGDYVAIGWAYDSQVIYTSCDLFSDAFGTDWTAFVFSDDIEWCKEHCEELGLTLFEERVFVEGNVSGKNYIDMQLMSECRGMIVSNSAFCYLAALLNKNKDCMLNTTKRQLTV